MIADISYRRQRLTLPVGLRIAVIIAAAVITTQPVELLFFKGQIERRIHNESIHLEAIVMLKNLQDAHERQSLGGVPTYYLDKQKKAEEIRRQEEKKLKDLISDLRATEASLSRAQERLRLAVVRLNNSEAKQVDYWKRIAASAKETLNNINARVTSLKHGVDEQQGVLDSSIKNEDKASSEVKLQIEDAVRDEQRVRNWIASVRQSKLGEMLQEKNDGWKFQTQRYDFFEQLRVLSDLCNGHPARWPDASQETRQMLIEQFNFASPDNELLEARTDTNFYNFSYWTVFGIAFVMPMVLLAFKLLQPQELRDYYSKELQKKYKSS